MCQKKLGKDKDRESTQALRRGKTSLTGIEKISAQVKCSAEKPAYRENNPGEKNVSIASCCSPLQISYKGD